MSPGDDATVLDGLLETVARDRDSRCRQLQEEAARRAAELRGEALRAARTRVREAVAAERRMDREAWRRVAARIETHHRLEAQRVHLERLRRGWVLMHDALLRRWRDPGARRLWLETAVQRARLVLPPDGWTVSHPGEWLARERGELHQWMHDSAGVEAVFEADEALDAGLVIRRDQVTVDASLDGLLVARHRIEAEFLAEFEALPA